MDSIFLTREQLEELTGLARPNAQRRWLIREGIAFRIRADGRPVVLVDELRQRPPHVHSARPNFAALDPQD